jgi:hypothetical membrane protein
MVGGLIFGAYNENSSSLHQPVLALLFFFARFALVAASAAAASSSADECPWVRVSMPVAFPLPAVAQQQSARASILPILRRE